MENLNFVFAMVKMHSQQSKMIFIIFKQNLDVIYRPNGRVLSLQWLFLVKNGNSVTFDCGGVHKILPLNVFSISFRLIGIHFDHCKNKI